MNHTLNPRTPNPAVLIAVVFLGKYLEALAMGRTSAALSKLLNLQPQVRLLITECIKEGPLFFLTRAITRLMIGGPTRE